MRADLRLRRLGYSMIDGIPRFHAGKMRLTEKEVVAMVSELRGYYRLRACRGLWPFGDTRSAGRIMSDNVRIHHRALFGDRSVMPEALAEMDRVLCSLPYYVAEDGVHCHTAPFGELAECGLVKIVRRLQFVRDDQSEVVLTGVQIEHKDK